MQKVSDVKGKVIHSIRFVNHDLLLIFKDSNEDTKYCGSALFKDLFSMSHQDNFLNTTITHINITEGTYGLGVVNLLKLKQLKLNEEDYSQVYVSFKDITETDKHELIICCKEILVSTNPYQLER